MKNAIKLTIAILLGAKIAGFLSACNFSPKPIECQRFKNGRFKLYDERDGSTTIITRNGNRQTEFIQGKTDTELHAVQWIDDCHYMLHYRGGLSNMTDSMTRFYRTHPIDVEIIKTAENYYIYSGQLVGVWRKTVDTLFMLQ